MDIDRDELGDLVTRLGRWLDDKDFDAASTVFAEDAEAHTPGGVAKGRDALVRQASRNHEVPTQHFITDRLIEVDGDRAGITANLLVVFVRPEGPRLLGERYDLRAVRTPDGWRIARVRTGNDVLWEMTKA